jgi:hypothetical protein
MAYRFSPSRLQSATLFPQYIGDVFVAFTSASCKFLKEVHAGDTLYPALEIIALTPEGDTGRVTTRATVHNQRGELVLDGEHLSLKTFPGPEVSEYARSQSVNRRDLLDIISVSKDGRAPARADTVWPLIKAG